jgi:hypothetical protein
MRVSSIALIIGVILLVSGLSFSEGLVALNNPTGIQSNNYNSTLGYFEINDIKSPSVINITNSNNTAITIEFYGSSSAVINFVYVKISSASGYTQSLNLSRTVNTNDFVMMYSPYDNDMSQNFSITGFVHTPSGTYQLLDASVNSTPYYNYSLYGWVMVIFGLIILSIAVVARKIGK